jgi:DNA adenine methylase
MNPVRNMKSQTRKLSSDDRFSNGMKIKAIVPYFGGKRNLAPTIVELIGRHRIYWEPFCGSMAVLMVKPPCELETVNDLHGDLINLARVIQDKEFGFQLYQKLSRTLYVEQFFRESQKRWMQAKYDDSKLDIDRAYDYFIVSWLGINGVSGTERVNYQFAMRWCIGGGQGAKRWTNVIESLPAWHKRLQNVVILQRDAFELIRNIKDEYECVIYCDPPYFDKSDKYVHDFMEQQHEQLAEILHRFKKARVIVSYYDNPKLEELYPDWEKFYFPKGRNSLRNATRGPKKKARLEVREVLLLKNFPKGLFDANI